jgi:hypothetical protein
MLYLPPSWHDSDLLQFAGLVIHTCQELGIQPVLNGSLYTHALSLQVHDVDLACSEVHFERIQAALQSPYIETRRMEWQVLRLYRDGRKVELDALERWLSDLPSQREVLSTDFFQVQVVSLDYLRTLYQRGINAQSAQENAANPKLSALRQKLALLHNIPANGN